MKNFWLFNKRNEPAEDIDTEYIYYDEFNDPSDKPDDASQTASSDSIYMNGYEDGNVSDVHVVTPAEQTEAPEEEKEEVLYKVTFTPEHYSESRDIVEAYMSGRVIVLNVEELDKENFLRLFDYIMGALQALEGEMCRIDRETVVLLPAGVDIEEIDIDELEEDPDALTYDEDETEDDEDID